ncbi:myelin-associated glycoprotein-like isoform X1 [Rhinatrema bivittatum]|uniref:myelin-associated glycoprotein-like isoform X1 n=1 Tax=Rhinatrema bivittatum TaxID=194408 RepID=UPI00112AA7EB|nr:myelin-associated glycoprotein-like isoform X1 [Rhinatrema bivittatum]XP_029433189.1 myelin-associated glycoprotein-like isoform X1 [Rhinatrema bivittatum]
MSIGCRVFLLHLCLPAFLPVNADWTVKMPRSLIALKQSCLVIPCVFNYPGQRRPGSDITATWYQNDDVVLYNSANSQTKARADLVGDLGLKNCSLWIKSVKNEDEAEYKFRVEIHNFDKYSFHNTAQVTVQETPPDPQLLGYRKNMSEGDLMTVTCRATHTCIMDPPTLVWNPQLDLVREEHRPLGEGEWEVISRQAFLVSASHHGKAVSCELRYPGGQRARTTGEKLSIIYAPKNTSVRTADGNTSLQEGSSVSLKCSSDSNPPATNFTWYRVHRQSPLTILPESGHILQATNISRNHPTYFCTARNELGAQNSTLLHLDVLYRPEILPVSSCKREYGQFECQCVVQSNPPALITWHLSDRNVNQTDSFFNVNVSMNGNVVRSLLVGSASLESGIVCSASNELGVMQLDLPVHGSQSWIIPTVAVSGAMLVLLLAVALIKHLWKRKKEGQCEKHPGIAGPPTVRKESPYSNEIFSKANFMEVYANVDFMEPGEHKDCALDCNVESSEASYQMVFPAGCSHAIYQNNWRGGDQ